MTTIHRDPRPAAEADPPDPFFAAVGRHALGWAVAAPAVVVVFLPMILWHAYVMATVWNWFVPGLFGLRPLGVGSALTVTVTLGTFRGKRYAKDPRRLRLQVAEMAIGPAASLAVAWAVKWAIGAGWLAI